MKLHDLRPPAGAHTKKTRVGRGIAAGKGKTAGRGTKGQKARAGGSIPPWFEGGQTPLHIRIPKLRGFRNINRIEYEVVNVGRISVAAETGRLPEGENLGVRLARPPVPASADERPVLRDHRSDHRVGRGAEAAVRRELEGTAHPAGVRVAVFGGHR